MIKYITKDNPADQEGMTFWDYCCTHSQPLVSVDTSGTRYWHINFDAFPVTKMERFTVINYSDHIIPLYKVYVAGANLPTDKVSAIGGGRNLRMCIRKEDAEMLAEKMFDLLVVLAEMDQERFDESPFELNSEGRNSEGFKPDGVRDSLKKMNDKDLQVHYMVWSDQNPHQKKYLTLIEEEISRRK
jgi:hypothetical protein